MRSNPSSRTRRRAEEADIRREARRGVEQFQFDPDLDEKGQKALETLRRESRPNLLQRIGDAIEARKVRRNPPPRKRGAKVVGFKNPDTSA